MALSCSPRPGAGEFISVHVTWEPGVTARCFVVRATGEGQAPRTTKPMVRGMDTLLTVAIFRDDAPAEVNLEALGFADEACLEPTGEVSALRRASFVKQLADTGLELRVLVTPIASGTDVDGDGSPTPADCDDGNPGVRPGLPEACGDTFDNDCDDVFDCADPDCLAQSCGLNRVCVGITCAEANCGNGLDDDADTQVDCVDPDCEQQPCGVGGTCRTGRCLAPTEALCDDDDDNDGNGLIDCVDPQCGGRTCSDGNGCTTGETCQGIVCSGGGARDCAVGLPACLQSQGCEAGRCLSAPAPSGATCGGPCTTAGLCDGDGGCSGAAVSCPAPPGPCFGAGTCQAALDGGCSFPVVLSNSCSDGDGCTTQDACLADGGCAGSRVSCPPTLGCRAFANTCTAGTCEYVNRAGLPCDGGSCNADGGCVPGGTTWPYEPTNFDPALLPVADSGFVIDCLEVQLDTQPVPAALTTVGCSNAARLSVPSVVVQLAAGEALLVSAPSFFLDAGARLTLVGSRPVIFAISGDVIIAGELVAAARGGRPGAGADFSCGTATGASGTAGTESAPGGSGGAFGSAGGAGGPGSMNAGTPAGPTTPVGNAALVPLRGGCSGGVGAGTSGGSRGRAGGGVQLSSTGAITITGLVGAPGEGGGGASPGFFGGGGAGSGGGVLLEAATLELGASGRVLALGGGGGEGSSSVAGNPGAPGSRTDGVAAPGGFFVSPRGGAGGAGASRTADAGAGSPGVLRGAGGGGGAGVGRVRFNSPGTCTFITGSLVSPSPTSADGGCQ